MTSALLLAFLLGMRHALETDHLAAVASLATRSRSLWHTVYQGAAWGLGHTVTLLVAGGICLAASIVIPHRLERSLEVCVGVMLLGLGLEVLWRARRQNVHLHVHQHEDGTRHLHAHSHAPGEAPARGHGAHPHVHPHPQGFPRRALLVGLMHGLAGSAALLLLTVTTLSSRWLGVAYILIFGLGSILGMAVLSAVIAVPLRGTAIFLTRAYRTVEVLTGLATLAVGVWVIAV
jgi:ABC-type nickel/cobalt efflux system permease component RcnA